MEVEGSCAMKRGHSGHPLRVLNDHGKGSYKNDVPPRGTPRSCVRGRPAHEEGVMGKAEPDVWVAGSAGFVRTARTLMRGMVYV